MSNNTSVDEVRTGLYLIKVGELKQLLRESAEELVIRLIDQVRTHSPTPNPQPSCSQYQYQYRSRRAARNGNPQALGGVGGLGDLMLAQQMTSSVFLLAWPCAARAQPAEHGETHARLLRVARHGAAFV